MRRVYIGGGGARVVDKEVEEPMTVSIRRLDPANPVTGQHKYYRANVSPGWMREHDNGVTVSCGLTVGEDNFTQKSLDNLIARGRAIEITQDEWNHSGCQSRCIRRGDKECRW